MGDTFVLKRRCRLPWKETQAVDERVQLIAECLVGQETIADVCRRFGVCRKTAYKWLARYKEDGPSGLAARSTKPHSNKRRPTDAVVATILDARRRHPTWGPGKLRGWLLDKSPALQLPAVSTMGDLLKEYGLVRPRRLKWTPHFGPQVKVEPARTREQDNDEKSTGETQFSI